MSILENSTPEDLHPVPMLSAIAGSIRPTVHVKSSIRTASRLVFAASPKQPL